MPNIREFLKKSMWYRNAKTFLPAATDMNHLNALAGTSSGQTGIISVWAQPTGWDEDGNAVITRTSMDFSRDDAGRPVDTLPIVAAVSVPGGKAGVRDKPVRIDDLAVTAASLFGLELMSTTIGKDLSGDLR